MADQPPRCGVPVKPCLAHGSFGRLAATSKVPRLSTASELLVGGQGRLEPSPGPTSRDRPLELDRHVVLASRTALLVLLTPCPAGKCVPTCHEHAVARHVLVLVHQSQEQQQGQQEQQLHQRCRSRRSLPSRSPGCRRPLPPSCLLLLLQRHHPPPHNSQASKCSLETCQRQEQPSPPRQAPQWAAESLEGWVWAAHRPTCLPLCLGPPPTKTSTW